MKLLKFATLILIGSFLCFAGAGCKHHPQGVQAIGDQSLPAPVGPGEPGKGVPTTAETSGIGEKMPTPAANPAEWANAGRNETKFAADTVHFDYDSSVVKSGEKAKVTDVADYLKSNPATGVEVQGHCDERGTDEYNKALGERRALAIREELISMGVDGGRVTTVSFGRSRPIDTGHSDAAHARNRRGVFILLSK